MTYFYTDQNNNQYTINSTAINYNPIKASESSSGTYSGGEKKSVRITEESFKELSQLSEALLSEGSNPNMKRKMMTAVLSTKKDGEFVKRILSASEERTALETLLRLLLK